MTDRPTLARPFPHLCRATVPDERCPLALLRRRQGPRLAMVAALQDTTVARRGRG